MRFLATYFIFLALISHSLDAISQGANKPASGKEPSWVTNIPYNYEATALETDAEDGYMDVLFEKQISIAEHAIYYKKTIKILSEAGIQNSSEISINFDPIYEKLIFHSIRIIRENSSINQLNLRKIKLIQQEKDLSKFQYDGSLTAVLFLEDVRKGDMIEYSYTMVGENPVFKGKFSFMFDLNYNVPVTRLYYKLIVPNGRKFDIKNSGSTISPKVNSDARQTVYEWKLDNVRPLHALGNLPSWYDPYSMVLVSEYKDWKQVVDWALELFPEAKNLSPTLLKKIYEIRINNPSAEKQVLAVLRFVQDEVRYMGIEMGVNSHRPAHPNKIFAQRFGDCKDKSYLLCTMLHVLQIEAEPVLIRTDLKKTILDWLPTARSFDHATVRVKLGDSYHWFDPTIGFQRGDINSISFPDYQYGLVISPNSTGLTKIDQKEPGMVRVKEVIDIKYAKDTSRLTVVTKYTGSYADDTRSNFNSSSRYEILKNYKQYYAAYYEDIIADSLNYKEDSTGAFITNEYYSIPNIWDSMNGVKKAYFNPFIIDGLVKKPKEAIRNMPFAIAYPAHYKEEVVVNLPEDWNVEENKEYIENKAFKLSAKYAYSPRKLILDYEYEALADHVAVEDSKKFSEDLKKKDEDFSYYISLADMGENSKQKTDNNFIKTKSKSNASTYAAIFVAVIFVGAIWWKSRQS